MVLVSCLHRRPTYNDTRTIGLGCDPLSRYSSTLPLPSSRCTLKVQVGMALKTFYFILCFIFGSGQRTGIGKGLKRNPLYRHP